MTAATTVEVAPTVWGDGSKAPLTSHDLITFVSEPVAVTQGSPLRAALCLMCRQAIGAAMAQVVGLICTAEPPRPSGALQTRGYLIHAAHRPADDAELHRAAHLIEMPHCPCTGQS